MRSRAGWNNKNQGNGIQGQAQEQHAKLKEGIIAVNAEAGQAWLRSRTGQARSMPRQGKHGQDQGWNEQGQGQGRTRKVRVKNGTRKFKGGVGGEGGQGESCEGQDLHYDSQGQGY